MKGSMRSFVMATCVVANVGMFAHGSEQRPVMVTNSFALFLDVRCSKACPSIQSQWYVDKQDPLRRSKLMFGRQLGLEIARQVTAAAKIIAETNDYAVVEEQTRLVLRLASWIGGAKGYGNIFLVARCHDVASVGLGRLLCSRDWPIDRSIALLRLVDTTVYDAKHRRGVLNGELEVPLFGEQDDSEEGIQKTLSSTWAFGHYCKDNLKREEVGDSQIFAQRNEQDFLTNLAFFVDWSSSSLDMPVTTENMWDKKMHGRLVDGVEPTKVRRVRGLAVFRDRVGVLPMVDGDKDGDSVYLNAWEPHWTVGSPREHRLAYASAWTVVSAILAGTFVDDDMASTRSFDLRQARVRFRVSGAVSNSVEGGRLEQEAAQRP